MEATRTVDAGRKFRGTVLEDQPDYDHLAQWKKSLDEGRSAPVIFTVIFLRFEWRLDCSM